MICLNCQHNNSPTAKFCEECGQPLKRICNQCQHQNKSTAKFCEECGFKLQCDQVVSNAPVALKSNKSDGRAGSDPVTPKAAERRQLTCLFCDLVGSTALSEQLDAEDYRQVILDYQQTAEKVIKRYGGHIAQYLGDGLLVYFGYPKGLEDAPKAAVQAGLGILEAVGKANQQWKAVGKTEINIRIGLHTGLVVVDDFLALGDTVNIAARLEGLAPVNDLVISPQTLKLVQGWFEVKSLGKEVLKGIKTPMEIFQVVKESGAQTRLEVRMGRGLSPLVGRDKEVYMLLRAWKRAKEGRGQFVLLNGEAGIGKSRLVESIKGQVKQEQQATKLELRCSDYHVNSPFYPLLDLLEKRILAFEKAESVESKINKLEEWMDFAGIEKQPNLPIYADFMSIPISDKLRNQYESTLLAPVGKKKKFQDGFTCALLNFSNQQSLLLIVEDLHWMDASTLEWLVSLIPQIHVHPLFVLCTTRPQFQPTWQTKSHVAQLNLHRLSANRIEAICRHQTQGKSLPKEVLQQIKDKTDGIPLFVEELTLMIIESDLLAEREDNYELKGDLKNLSIPSTLQDSLIARLDRLAEAKEIAQIGAVLGREFSFELMQAVTRNGQNNLEIDLLKLVSAEILFQRGIAPKSKYIFKHALIRDAAYGSLLKKRRQQLHQKIAEILVLHFKELIENQPEILAHHLTEAILYEKAMLKWEEAGYKAITHSIYIDAIHHYKKALSLLEKIPRLVNKSSKELELLMLYHNALMGFKGWIYQGVEKNVQRIVDLLENGQNDELYFNAHLGLLGMHNIRGNWKKSLAIATQGLERANAIKHERYSVFFNTMLGDVNFHLGNFKTCNFHFHSSLELYIPAKHDDLTTLGVGEIEVWAKIFWSWALLFQGYPEQAKNKINTISINLESQKDMPTLYRNYVFKAFFQFMLKEWNQALEEIQPFLPIIAELKDSIFYLAAQLGFNYFALFINRNSDGLQEILNHIAHLEKIGMLIWNPFHQNITAEILLSKGNFKDALNRNKIAIEIAKKTNENWWLSPNYRQKGELLLLEYKNEKEAEQNFFKAIDIAQQQSAKWFELLATKSLARLWQSQGKTTEAYELLNDVYSWFTEGFDTIDMKEAKTLLEKLKLKSKQNTQ